MKSLKYLNKFCNGWGACGRRLTIKAFQRGKCQVCGKCLKKHDFEEIIAKEFVGGIILKCKKCKTEILPRDLTSEIQDLALNYETHFSLKVKQ